MNAITDIPGQGLTRKLAEQACALRLEDIPEDIRAWARQCVLDYVACTLAGAKEELTEILLAEMQEQGGKGSATIMGHGVKLPPAAAAIVNGSAAHALDYDDVNLAMPGHPTVAILPALLALAEERGATGAEVLTAFVAGYELQCRIGQVMAPGHYDVLGFHATATVGSFGSAAACAHLMGLDPEKTAIALGIAGTQAAGLKSMFGTMCKPLHAGKASYHGLMAAKLAARGFTSRADVVECAQGFAKTHSPDFNPEKALETPPQGWYIRNNLFKYHAACYLTHAAIDACRALKRAHNLVPDRVGRVVLRLDESLDRICNVASPKSGLEAKFSLRQTAAMALAGVDTSGLVSYSAETANDPRLVALRQKVEIEFVSGWSQTRTAVEIETTDGAQFQAEHDAGIAATDIAGQGQRLVEKFTALVEPLYGTTRCSEIIALVNRLDELTDVGPLAAACRAETAVLSRAA